MKRPLPALIPFLVFISLVFIGILIYAYVETKKANPQMIETGSAFVGRGVRTRACRIPTHRDAWRPAGKAGCPEESGHGTHECVRHNT
jgi:hypothetical protein